MRSRHDRTAAGVSSVTLQGRVECGSAWLLGTQFGGNEPKRVRLAVMGGRLIVSLHSKFVVETITVAPFDRLRQGRDLAATVP